MPPKAHVIFTLTIVVNAFPLYSDPLIMGDGLGTTQSVPLVIVNDAAGCTPSCYETATSFLILIVAIEYGVSLSSMVYRMA